MTREPPPSRRTRTVSIVLLVVGFIALHVLLDRYLRLAPGDYTGVPGLRLLEIFASWFPILFLAAFLPLGTGRRIPTWARFTVLLGYAATLVSLVAPAAHGNQAANDWFFLLVRIAPIPALVFLLADGRRHWSLARCAGLAFMFFMLWRSLYFNFPDLLVIAGGGATLPATPARDLYINLFISALWDLVYPILGLLLFFHRLPGIHIRARWGDQLERVLRPIGAWTRRTAGIDAAWGLVLFVLNFVAAILIANALARSSTGSVGDDSAVFNEITLDQVFLLSIVAGVGEELVFRGLLMTSLLRLLPRFRARLGTLSSGTLLSVLAPALTVAAILPFTTYRLDATLTPNLIVALVIGLALIPLLLWDPRLVLAIVLQAIPFAIVHSGYADLDHIIQPFLFGLFMGVVFRFFGIIPAMIIHTEIDVFAFGVSYAQQGASVLHPEMYLILTVLFFVNLIVGGVYLAFQLLEWWDTRRRALAIFARA